MADLIYTTMNKKLNRKERTALEGKTVSEIARQYSIPPNKFNGKNLLMIEDKKNDYDQDF